MEYSAGFIIKHNNNYLLIQEKATGDWGFPKGHLETGEDNLTAAKRELKEETGLDARAILGFEAKISYPLSDSGKEKTVTYFLGAPTHTNIKEKPNEIAAYAWLPYQKAHKQLSHENVRIILKDAQKFLKEQKIKQ
jgi:8-oxo-dGTP pyrophosphatase MutT (NUDIX family)